MNSNTAEYRQPVLLYQGQASIRIISQEGKVIYIDPYAGNGYDLPADLILMTHGHYDHCAVERIAERNPDCRIVSWKEALAHGRHNRFDFGFARVQAVEAGGRVRNVMSADLSTEDFQAAVDFLSVQDNVDPERVGILGICGWGGMALNTAALDTRIKATVVSTMYDMTRLTRNGYFDAEDTPEQRYEKKKALNAQHTEDYRNGTYARNGGLPEKAAEDAPQFLKDYVTYYRGRGYNPRAVNPNGGWNTTSDLGLLSMPILQYSEEIRSAVLMIHGEKAHSLYFGREAFSHLRGDNKEFVLVPGASHTDLYDTDKIPFDKIEAFYRKYLG